MLISRLLSAVGLLCIFTSSIAAVGRTPGEFSVDEEGAAKYTIPIKLPAGPKGLQPNLAIKYDSQSGDGTMGPGWYLSGLGSITRCDKTYAQDSAASAVSLVTTDGYCLNDSRMRLVSGSYGTAASTYQTELADFAKITAYGSAGNGPGYFIVQRKDGRIYEYGNSNDGSTYNARITASGTSTPYQWRLNKVRDRAGNNYVVTYGTGQSGSVGVGVPLSISYVPSSAGSTSYDYSISFAYGVDTAAGTQSGYVAGGSTVNNNRLTGITVQRGVTVIHRYNFGYELATVTNRYRLNLVTECPGTAIDSTCLSPTSITYQNGATGVSTTLNAAISGTSGVKGAYDFNGDGRDDILYVYGSTLYVAFANASGYGTPVSTGVSISAGDLYEVGDLVGSGKSDIFISLSNYWYRVYWNGTAFASTAIGLAKDGGEDMMALTDINGDGLPDLVTTYSNASTSKMYVYSRLNTSSAGIFSISTSRASTLVNSTCINSTCYNMELRGSGTISNSKRRLDFNGDGRGDIQLRRMTYVRGDSGLENDIIYTLISNGSSFSSYTYTQANNFADFNDDKCTDGVKYQNNATVYIAACSGNAASTITIGGTYLATMDWDGDGRDDLLVNNGGYVGVYLSTGSGFSAITTTSTLAPAVAMVFNQDGDGLGDLGYVNTSSPYAVTYRLHEAAGTPPDLLSSITDGYGVSYSPIYVSIAQSSVYTKGSGATQPVKDIQDARYVVSQVSISDGVGGSYTQSYTYAGARQDIQGRGFMGFQSITVADSRVDAPKVKTYYKTAFPYDGMVYQRDVSQNNGTTLISRTVNTPSVINLDTTAYNQRYFPYVWSSTTDNYEVGGVKNSQWITSTTTSFNYDNYGNVTSRTSVVTDKDGTAPQSPTYNQTWTQVTTNTFTPDTGNWCVGLPTQTTEQYYATGALSVTRTASFTPDYVNCRVTQQVIEPSSSIYKVTADYGYGAFGNVSSIAITGKKPDGTDMATRTTTINWDTTGQFPISATNPEGHIAQAGYSYNLGVPINQTDPNGLVTGWTYDTLGRKLTETRPDGTSTTWSYNDCASVSGGCQNGDPFSGSTGINKMVVIATDKDSGGTAIQDSWTYLDQLERALVTKSTTLSGGYSRVGVQYNALGQLYRQTAPCEASSCAVYWTTNTYDALGRITTSSRPVSASNSTLQTTTVAYQGLTTVTTDPQNKSKTHVADPKGGLRTSMDHDGYYQSFTYDAFGSLKAVTDSSANTLFSASYAYGVKAFQTQTADMDLGIWNYTVNALGEVTAYTDANGSIFTMTYDKLSRLLTRAVSGEGVATWTWGSSAGSYNIGQLQNVTSTGGTTEIYVYDNKGRLSQKDITADGTTFSYNYAYNTLGKLDTLTYPTSTSSYRLALKYLYANGVLQQVKDNAAGTVFWHANAANANGQIVQQTLGNGIVTNRNYDAVTGLLNAIQSGMGGGAGIQNESYLWDKAGNLTQRQNNTLGLTESFYYDNLYRLDYSQLNGVTNLDLTYDALGRITNRSDVASNAAWTYHSTKKHAVTQAGSASYTYTYDNNGNAITRNGQSLTWSQYNYPKVINGSASESVTLSYDANNARWKQVYVNGGATETTLYLGKLMEKVVTSSTTDYRYYIHANGRAAVAVMSRLSTGINATRYVLEDHQDSPSKITDASGGVYVSESFTAYGARRNAATWSGAPTSTDLTNIANVSHQGYTWQTALGNMGLNHMNGRVQDALTGVFLSADPYITDVLNTQNYHRYGYVYNNPLSYIDPSGFDVQCDHVGCLDEIVVEAGGYGGSDSGGDYGGYGNSGSYYSGGPYSEGGGSSGGEQTSKDAENAKLEEIVVTATREPQQEEVSIDWMQAANDWWPGFQIGTCLYSGCGVGTWAMGILGAIPGVAAEVKGAKVATNAAKAFSKEKQALIDMAKADKRNGITNADMQAYKDLNRGLPDPFPSKQVRGPEAHSSGAPSSQAPHGHVGPVDHIPIVEP